MVKKYKKKYHYVCEQKGGMVQSRLSFTRTVTHSAGVARGTDLVTNSGFTTSTEGQRGSDRTIQAGNVVDEKKLTDEKFVCARGRR